MMESFKNKVFKILTEVKRIKESDLKAVLEKQKRKQMSISRILVEDGLVSEKDLMLILSRELNIPPINLSKYKIDQEVARLIPEKVARQFSIIPISRIGDVLTLAMSDPLNIMAMDEVKLLTNYKIDPVIATAEDIRLAHEAYYGSAGRDQVLDDASAWNVGDDDVEIIEERGFDTDEVYGETEKAPIIKMVDLILNEAMSKRASDIHVEPCEKHLRVRYRIDGELHEAFKLPKKNQNAIIARLKIMSKLDISQTRLPQDGRFRILFEGKKIDLRVSSLPVAFGPKIVLRLLDKSNLSVGLERLGFSKEPLGIFADALKRPYGMILVTGPTGSGKSTTLYSIINNLNNKECSIITLEEPVEYELDGITQVEVRSDIGLTFANGLRSILRQNPDVIMVGEIRDFETADIAIKASLTGQLILSTLHTNDSVSVITRLTDMKIEPFLLASSLIMAGAQRLMRAICPNCKTEARIPQEAVDALHLDSKKFGKARALYSGKGCERCNGTGYFGRFGILEAFLVDDAVREMIIRRASADDIKKYLMGRGMKTLREEALENLFNGVTTLEEVLRVTSEG